MGRYDLPPRTPQRWVVRHKANVLEAIRNGELSLEDACTRYALTTDEILSWQVSYGRHGIEGLRAMKVQIYRGSQRRSAQPMFPEHAASEHQH